MTQKFSRRISVLTANTRRLSNNEELLAPIGGDDELSRLDESFRQMAQMLLAAQEKEKANEARIRAFIDNMQVGLLIVDDKGEITQSNPYVEELFGYSAEELIGQRIAALFCDSETMSLDAFLDMLTERALGKAAQIQAINSVGKTFPVEAKLSIMQSDLGTRLVLNIVDLTAKFEVERLKKEMVSMV
ncbi:MAG: PAS domain S-box protein, partial [Cyanobacteria bacterium HKST-UBA01]|nr:PAS domain S-box protein [Cyanobacteria bacterium HKST-UBA01]